MLVVVALGGNALLRRGEPPDVARQRDNVRAAAAAIGTIAQQHRVVVTHGNGPQVGLLALQNEAYHDVAPYPLDVLGAESEGMVGYLVAQELARHIGSDRVATLLTQVVVDWADPAFSHPTKFVGPVYDKAEAERVAGQHDWTVRPDGAYWRRVVPSPEPKLIIELHTIQLLVDHGITVVCAGGGGVPVVPDERGGVRGVEAVVDKDLSAALLATALGADALVLLTDVDGVYAGFGTDGARRLAASTPAELRALDLPLGSMAPKADAACRFVEQGGTFAAIGALDEALAVAEGRAGTVVRAR